MTTKCGHLRPQNLIFTDRANKTSTVHGVTCDHRMRSLTTTKHFHNRTTAGGGVGGGGVAGMITYLWLAHRYAERWSGLPALGLHTCWPILVGGGGVGGMITYLGLHTDTPKGGLVYRMITYLGLHTDTPKGERWPGLPALGLHTCWPILVGGGGVGGMITYFGLHTDTPKGGR